MTQLTTTTPAPVSPAGTYYNYHGGFFQVLIASATTQHNFSLIDISLPKGVEPPSHTHTREDETFYLLEGEMTFYIGEQCITARPGEAVFAPRMVPHHFKIMTASATFLTLITPGTFLDYFLEFSTPCDGVPRIIPPQGPPPAAHLENITRQLTQKYGVLFQ
ncbi:cupin domain-containing protein [Chitinophaga sp. HK235]|uniref:cupin domain-containing protein n=1 Tax=Chitinophaga sp. HK235 TaxID=2952571 RepID=UPI001BAAC358|nr:cupin domain-containing protein [Chitinophaga sp. HK235]